VTQTWACISADGVVDNCIIADQAFVDMYLPGSPYALILALDGVLPVPSPGWHYDSEDDVFTAPQ
jgi:hypothetical protein